MHQTIDEMSLIKSLSVLIHQCSQPFNDHSWYASYAEVVFCSSCSMFRADYKYFHECTKLQNFHLSRWRAYSSITFSWQANLWNLFQTPCMHETSPTLSRVSFKTNKQTSKRTNKQTASTKKAKVKPTKTKGHQQGWKRSCPHPGCWTQAAGTVGLQTRCTHMQCRSVLFYHLKYGKVWKI